MTNVSTAEMHEHPLKLSHKLATLMPHFMPYLSITVVILATGEDLANCDIPRFPSEVGKGGVLQTYEVDIWVNWDSCDK